MKKRILIITITTALSAMLLAGCANGSNTETTTTTPVSTTTPITTTTPAPTTTLAPTTTVHTHSYTETITTEASCEADGVKTFTCECGDNYTETISKFGHEYNSVITVPTCTEAGFTTHTCTRCNNSYTDTDVAATGHTYDAGVITTEATCETDGIKTFTCECSSSYVEEIAAIGHNYEAVADSAVNATCLNAGKKADTKCSICDDIIEGAAISATGHNYGKYAYNNDATTEADGTETATCKICSNKTTRTKAGTRIEICPYELYVIKYDNQGYPYYYGKWGGSANMDAENWTKTEACSNQVNQYMRDNYTIWNEDRTSGSYWSSGSWQSIGRYQGMQIVVRYIASCNDVVLGSPESRGIPTAGNGIWQND